MADEYVPSFTPQNLAILEKAIAGGVRRVKYSDKEIEYRSLAELIQIHKVMKAAVQGSTTRGKRGFFGGRGKVARHSKGLTGGSRETFNGCVGCDDDGDI